jgi:hypothetical protein
VRLEFVAALLQQRGSVETGWDGRWFVPRRLRLLIGHLQEQQEGELLHVVEGGDAVVAQHLAVRPELCTS